MCFFKQKTAYEMRISDWSSDVCSSDLPRHKVVGITGTNGKSTTTALVAHILQCAGIPALMGGNIGIPIMEQQPLEPNDKGVGVYVLELSSYQIDQIGSTRLNSSH